MVYLVGGVLFHRRNESYQHPLMEDNEVYKPSSEIREIRKIVRAQSTVKWLTADADSGPVDLVEQKAQKSKLVPGAILVLLLKVCIGSHMLRCPE